MDEPTTKTCPNCKRDIPSVNFQLHSAHCARNIGVCPVCKEPVPHSDIQEHHDKLHKLLPCKQCGESVCGTDLEDHIRDSCGHTMKTCRYCSLELRRRELPAHERYCGARTEQCAACREYVMLKYRQIHLDSNHGFLRLHDDPAPVIKPDRALPTFTPFGGPSTSKTRINGLLKNPKLNQDRKPQTEIRYFNSPDSNDGPQAANIPNGFTPHTSNSPEWPTLAEAVAAIITQSGPNSQAGQEKRPQSVNGAISKKRNNDQPQININSASADKVNKNLGRGIKKRPAPRPPREPPARAERDLPYYSALRRQQDEENTRQEQTAKNLALGLPPVLSPAAKLDKLRKIDALHNRGTDDTNYKNKLQGRVWMSPEPSTSGFGNTLGSSPVTTGQGSAASGSKTPNSPDKVSQDPDIEKRKNDFKNLKPMTPEEFINRFNELRLREEASGDARGENRDQRDRFSQIKSSLQELRRGLNQVTAPYNSYANADNNPVDRGRDNRLNVNEFGVLERDGSEGEDGEGEEGAGEEVRLPCEFCSAPVPLDMLVQHQTGCRPDLAQYRAVDNARPPSPSPPSPPSPPRTPRGPRGGSPVTDPVIPCEFCTESLPVYLISEHQERCGRDANLLFPD